MNQRESDPNARKAGALNGQDPASRHNMAPSKKREGPVIAERSRANAEKLCPIRLAVGAAAGFLSVLIFSHGMIAVLHPNGLFPFGAWDMTPVPPFGVPQTFSSAFWGGLWGIVYAILEARITARLGWWQGGLVFGAVLPMLVFWFIVLTLKGTPIGTEFFLSSAPLVSTALHTFFGLGTAIFFKIGLRIANIA